VQGYRFVLLEGVTFLVRSVPVSAPVVRRSREPERANSEEKWGVAEEKMKWGGAEEKKWGGSGEKKKWGGFEEKPSN
jgi:hypothetical protein